MTEWRAVRMLPLTEMIEKLKNKNNEDEGYKVDVSTVLQYWRARLTEVLPLAKGDITMVNCPDKYHKMSTTEDTFYLYLGYAAPGKHRYTVLSKENDAAPMKVHKPLTFLSMPL